MSVKDPLSAAATDNVESASNEETEKGPQIATSVPATTPPMAMNMSQEVLVTVDPATGERTVIPEETKRIETLKQAGNECFTNEKYVDSLKLYTEAIGLLREALKMSEQEPFDRDVAQTLSKTTRRLASVLLSNRANSFMRLDMSLQSLDDAEQAIDVDPTYPKAYFRRGTALLSLGRGEEAMNDFHKAAFLCPKDPSAIQKVRECENFVKLQARERSAEAAELMSRRRAIEMLSKVIDDPTHELGPPDPARYHDSILSAEPTVDELEKMIDGFKKGKRVHGHYIAKMLFKVLEILKKLPNVVRVDLEPGQHITVVGDIHGQFYDLLHIFEINGLPSDTNPYLFNGDFVDRGAWGVEVILTLFTLKCMYPNHVHLARGNHETSSMNRTYGFSQEAYEKYGEEIEVLLSETFCSLPLAHVLGGKIFVVHGGLSAKTPRDIASIEDIQKIDRFCQPPDNSIMSDLLWSDPQELRGVTMSQRGIGCLFGPDITNSFLERNGLTMIIRSHESVMTGCTVMHQGKLATIFSAPNYCDTLGNSGAIVRFTAPDMIPDYTTFRASSHPSVTPRFGIMNLFRF